MKRLGPALLIVAVCLVSRHELLADLPAEQIYIAEFNPSVVHGYHFDGSALVRDDLDLQSTRTALTVSSDIESLSISNRFSISGNLILGLTVGVMDRDTGVELPRPRTTQGSSSATGISADGRFGYVLGTRLSGGRSLLIIDLRPESPTFDTQIGSLDLVTGTSLAVDSAGGKVFVAGSGTGGVHLLTVDVSNPTAPSVLFDALADTPGDAVPINMHAFTSLGDRFLLAARRSAQIYLIAADGSLSFVQALDLAPATTTVRDIAFAADASGDHAYALVTSTVAPIGGQVQAIDMARIGASFNGGVINTATLDALTTTGRIVPSGDGDRLYVQRGAVLTALSRNLLLTSPASAVLTTATVDATAGAALVGLTVAAPGTPAGTISSIAVDGVVGAVLINDRPRTITVNGSNLGGVTQAFVGLTRAQVTSVTPTQVTITTPTLVPAATAPLLLVGTDGSTAGTVTVANRPTYLPAFVSYASATGSNEIWKMNAATKSEVASHFPTGPGPTELDATTDGRLLLSADFRGSAITVHSLLDDATMGWTAGQRLADVPAGGASPERIAINPTRPRAYATTVAGTLFSVIDTDRTSGTFLQVLSTVTIPIGARSAAITPDGRFVYVGLPQNPFLAIVDVTSDILTPVNVTTMTLPDGPTVANRTDGLIVSPDGQRLYFTTSLETAMRVFDISLPTAPVQIASVSLPGAITGDVRRIQARPDGQFVYVSSRARAAVDVYDPGLGTFVDTIPTGGFSNELAVSPQSDYLFVAVGETDEVMTVDTRATVGGSANPALHTVIASTRGGGLLFGVAVSPGVETDTGANVSVEPLPAVTLTFSQVTIPGNTTVTSGNVSNLVLPPHFAISGVPVFFDVRTTAAFTGPVTVCVPYDATGLSPADEAGLRLLHEEGGVLVDRTVGSPDLVNHRVCGLVPGFSQLVVAGFANQAPVCSAATPTVSRIWPPNHKLVTIGIRGVTDSDHDALAITVSSIFQDEPTNTSSDRDNAIDGFGVGTSLARVRAERAGMGNGRVYHIRFGATDGFGGSCAGEVRVSVPNDSGHAAVDDGPRFDSTVAFPSNWHYSDKDRDHDRDQCSDDRHDHRNDKKGGGR